MQPRSDTPDPGGRTPASARVAPPASGYRRLAGVLGVLLAVPFLLVGYRAWYGATPWQTSPDRIRWCLRDFDRSGTTLTRAQVDADPVALPGDAPYPLSTVGRWPAPGWFGSGRPLLAKLTPEQRRAELDLPCTMALYLRTGPDSYALYTLVGGP